MLQFAEWFHDRYTFSKILAVAVCYVWSFDKVRHCLQAPLSANGWQDKVIMRRFIDDGHIAFHTEEAPSLPLPMKVTGGDALVQLSGKSLSSSVVFDVLAR